MISSLLSLLALWTDCVLEHFSVAGYPHFVYFLNKLLIILSPLAQT